MSETSEGATPEDFKVIAPAHVDRTRYITALMGRRDNLDTQVLWDDRWVSLPITDGAMALFPSLKLSSSATSLQPPTEFLCTIFPARQAHEVGKLLTTIDGVGPLTAACLIAELGDPARFRSAGAIASYVGVVPRLRQSGKKRFSGSPTIPFGNARLRKALWMVVLNAVRCNPWLRRQYYERLRAAGKPGKVAVIAAMRAVWSVATHRKPFVPHLPRVPAPLGAVTNKA
jgi:hypothetical protein